MKKTGKSIIKALVLMFVFTVGISIYNVSAAEIEAGSTSAVETTKSTEEVTTKQNNPTEVTTNEVTTEEPTTEVVTEPEAPYTLIAHRGYSGAAPDNSLPAFEKAVAADYRMIELDIIRCKPDASGKATWVISHDNNLKSNFGVDKNISDLTYSQLMDYPYVSGSNLEQYNNLKMITYDQILNYIKDRKEKGYKLTWQIEIKDTGDTNYYNYFKNEVVQPVLDMNLEDCVTFSSFHYTFLKRIKEDSDNKIRVWFLRTILDDKTLGYASACKAEGISFKGTVDYTTKEMIDKALSQGYKLGTYTINSPVVMGAYLQWGIKYYATDKITPIDVTEEILKKKHSMQIFACALAKKSYVYDNTRKLPKVTVKYKDESLVQNVNYTLSYENNKNPGTAVVYVSGINNCKDEVKLTYRITMPTVKNFKVKSTSNNYVKLTWDRTNAVTGYIIEKYNEATKKYDEIKTIAKGKTVSCKLKKLTSASKYKYRIKSYVTVDGKTYKSSSSSAKTAYTKPNQVKLKSAVRYGKNKKIKLKWYAPARCSGYQVKIATDKKMTKLIGTYTVSKRSRCNQKIKKLSAKKNYYLKVRAFYKDGATKTYGTYSKILKSKPKNKK